MSKEKDDGKRKLYTLHDLQKACERPERDGSICLTRSQVIDLVSAHGQFMDALKEASDECLARPARGFDWTEWATKVKVILKTAGKEV